MKRPLLKAGSKHLPASFIFDEYNGDACFFPICQLTGSYRVHIDFFWVNPSTICCGAGFKFGGDLTRQVEFVTLAAHREQRLGVVGIGLEAGAQAAHQVFNLVIKNGANFKLGPHGLADIVL